jgi:hypothetical protein
MTAQSQSQRAILLLGGLAVLVGLVAATGAVVAAPSAAGDVENVSLYVSEGEFDDAAGVETAIADGTLEPADRMVVGETLVVAITSERLEADLSARNGTTTERFFDVLAGDAYFGLVGQNANPNVARKAISPDPANTTVSRNGSTTYLSFETEELDVGYFPPWEDSGSGATLYEGDRFAVLFGYDANDLYRGPQVSLFYEAAAFVDPAGVVAPEQVTGTVRTFVPPEDDLTVRTIFENGSTTTTRVSVNSSSSTEYSLDFRGVSPKTAYTLELVYDGNVVDRHEGTVREPEATLWDADVAAVEGGSVDARVTLVATLTHGGTVVVRDGFGARVGSTTVPPGEATDLSIDLRFADSGAIDPDELHVVAVRDVGDVAQRYPGGDAGLLLDVSQYEWGTDDWTPASESRESGGTDSTGGADADQSNGSPEEVPTVGPAPSDSDGSLAGFGMTAGAVALVAALCSTGYVLRRRFRDR